MEDTEEDGGYRRRWRIQKKMRGYRRRWRIQKKMEDTEEDGGYKILKKFLIFFISVLTVVFVATARHAGSAKLS